MNFPNYTPDQYVDADMLNAASNAISGSVGIGLQSTFIPGVVSPNSATFGVTGLAVTVNLPAPFGVISTNGVLAQAHGGTTGSDTQSYNINFSGAVPGSGSTTAYCMVSGISIQQTAIAIPGPPPGHPDFNPNFVPTTGYQNNIDSLAVFVSTTAPDNLSTFEVFRVSLAAGATGVGGVAGLNLSFQNRRAPTATLSETRLAVTGALTAERCNVLTVTGTYTLPYASISNGQEIVIASIVPFGSGNCAVNSVSGDSIFGTALFSATGGVTGFSLPPGSAVKLISLPGSGSVGIWQTQAGSYAGQGTPPIGLLQQNTTFYVATNGVDSLGRGTTQAMPFATINFASRYVQSYINANGFSISIAVSGGTYNGDNTFTGQPPGSVGAINLQGGSGTVTLNGTAGAALVVQSGANVNLANGTWVLKFSGSVPVGGVGAAIIAQLGGTFTIPSGGGGPTTSFDVCTGPAQILSQLGGSVNISTSYSIINSASGHIVAQYNGTIQVLGGITTTLTGTPNFSTAFANANHAGVLVHAGNNFSGGATGPRYSVTLNGIIDTSGGGANYFPGNQAGASGTGGQYV